ncbi:hypothetical protein JCM10207_002278 [Rhodosporidiobolus poonsookiae]
MDAHRTAVDACDEGGVHEYRYPDKGTGGFCAAAVSPVGMLGGSDARPNEATCVKCGLDPSEAQALGQARMAEAQGLRTSKGAGYFTNPMPSYPPPSASSSPPSRHKPSPAPSPVPASPLPPPGSSSTPPPQVMQQKGEDVHPVERWLSNVPPPQGQQGGRA